MEAAAMETAHNLSAWSLFMQADIIVKGVMLGLLAASVWCWAIIFEKIFLLRRLWSAVTSFEKRFWSGGSVEDLYNRLKRSTEDPMGAVFVAGMREWRRAAGRGLPEGMDARTNLVSRVERVMDITIGREMDRLEHRLGFLATVGSTAPFVGLFGTVWGIMNSFSQIGAMKDTSLAVVAPGIAEALFATAIGLVAAIPAVIAYNRLSKGLDRYVNKLETFSGEFIAILSRQLDEHGTE